MTKLLRAAVFTLAISTGSTLHAADPVQPPQDFKIDKDAPQFDWWRESMKTKDQRLGWWREARFGMFVHWGVYSSLGNTYNGRKGGGYAEHIQRVLKIPIPEYREKVAGQFNPTQFNADEWIGMCKAAGMDYFVITAKHHDGFAMWDSKIGDYDVIDATPWKHDPMKDLKAACEKHGVKFGFYYSHAFDWGEKEGAGNDWDFDNPGGDKNLHGGRAWYDAPEGQKFIEPVRRYVDNKAIPQIQELIANYQPALLWFDTPHKISPYENFRVLRETRKAGPDVVINGRLLRGYGDYQSTADRPAEFPPTEGDWEGIPTTNESYAWSATDTSHKPASHFIQLLVKAAARGGNLLMNIGPRGDGTIDKPDVEILQGIGKWMKVNAESIKGTTRTPLAVQSWGESTRKGNTLYLHVFNWPKDGKLVVGGLKSKVSSAFLLSDTTESSLEASRSSDLDVQINVPLGAPDSVDSVVVVNCDADIACDPARLLASNAENALRVFDGKLEGRSIRFGPGKKTDAFVTQWSDPNSAVYWDVRVTQPTTFNVSAVYDAANEGGKYAVKVGTQSLSGTVKKAKLQSDALGTLKLEPGNHQIKVVPEKIEGSELMNLRTLVLTPQ